MLLQSLYPEVYFPLILSGFTAKICGMSGETLAILVFLDTLIGGYLLNVTLNVRMFRCGKRATN